MCLLFIVYYRKWVLIEIYFVAETNHMNSLIEIPCIHASFVTGYVHSSDLVKLGTCLSSLYSLSCFIRQKDLSLSHSSQIESWDTEIHMFIVDPLCYCGHCSWYVTSISCWEGDAYFWGTLPLLSYTPATMKTGWWKKIKKINIVMTKQIQIKKATIINTNLTHGENGRSGVPNEWACFAGVAFTMLIHSVISSSQFTDPAVSHIVWIMCNLYYFACRLLSQLCRKQIRLIVIA